MRLRVGESHEGVWRPEDRWGTQATTREHRNRPGSLARRRALSRNNRVRIKSADAGLAEPRPSRTFATTHIDNYLDI